MNHVQLPNKYPGETVALVFDFDSFLAQDDSLTGTASAVCSVYAGTDPLASTMVISIARNANVVRVNLGGGVAGVIYSIDCSCATTLSANPHAQGFVACLPNPL